MSAAEIVFDNRQDAGRKLAEKLSIYKNQSAVVLAIPNGGVPVGIEVARALNADFDLIICRKIPLPLTPEAGFGAIAENGTIILNDELVKGFTLSQEQINSEAVKVRAEIKRRTLLYKFDRPPVRMTGRVVIIVDDGLASGITMTAAVQSVHHRRPKEVVAAAPCASEMAVKQLEKVADKVVSVVTVFRPRFAVADFYRHWYDVSDEEVLRNLNQWRTRRFRSNISSTI